MALGKSLCIWYHCYSISVFWFLCRLCIQCQWVVALENLGHHYIYHLLNAQARRLRHCVCWSCDNSIVVFWSTGMLESNESQGCCVYALTCMSSRPPCYPNGAIKQPGHGLWICWWHVLWFEHGFKWLWSPWSSQGTIWHFDSLVSFMFIVALEALCTGAPSCWCQPCWCFCYLHGSPRASWLDQIVTRAC